MGVFMQVIGLIVSAGSLLFAGKDVKDQAQNVKNAVNQKKSPNIPKNYPKK